MTAPDTKPQRRDDEVSVAERRLLHAAITGVRVDLRTGDHELDDPAQGATRGPDRTIRAELLVELLTGERAPDNGRLRAVKLRGAHITGELDLEAAELVCPLLLQDCHIEEPVILSEATAPAIRLPGCYLHALKADELRTTSDLELCDGFAAVGEVNLLGARIGGQLDLSGANLRNPDGYALYAAGLTVDLEMFCGEGFVADGEVALNGARIGGELGLGGASLRNPGGRALRANGLTVEQDMVCTGFAAEGEVLLLGARIGGQLDLSGANLRNPDGYALFADELTVNLSMFCTENFVADGEVRLPGARIGGQLSFSNASLRNLDGWALMADQLTVGQDMFCEEGFIADGEVRLPGARIGGMLSFIEASLRNPGRYALSAFRLTIAESMLCGEGLVIDGKVSMCGAHIVGELSFIGASLRNPDGDALDLEGASIGGLTLRPANRPEGAINLTNARAAAFHDDQATWPRVMRLRGFVYETLENDSVSVRSRLGWLIRHSGGYAPGLYDHLAATYRRAGHEEAARKVAIAKQWRRRGVLNPAGKLLNWLLYLTVGYGYRTWLAAAWLAGLLAVGIPVFDRAYPADMASVGSRPPPFHAVAYTLDVLLPIVDLGQQRAWQPEGAAMYVSWALIGAGWALTTAVVAGLTGVLKRD